MSEPASPPRAPRDPTLWQPPAWFPPVVFAAICIGMLAWNPDGWIHPLIDYGRELYVPWRLTAGEVLYRDIAYFNGPLSQYYNAAWFLAFGVNMHVLTVSNMLIALGALALLYHLIHALSDRLTATVGGVVFLVLFVFQHADSNGNFSWVAPYSHEMTHGVALGILCVWLATKYTLLGRRRNLLGAGLVLGAVFLTKPEVFVATDLACATALFGRWLVTGRRIGTLLRDVAIATGCALVVPLLAFLLLQLAMPAGQALRGVCGGFTYMFETELTSLKFYSEGRGTHDIPGSLRDNLAWNAILLAWLACGALLAWALRKPPGLATAAAVALVFVLPLYDHFLAPPRDLAIQPVLLVTLILTGAYALQLRRRDHPTALRGIILCAFGLGLLAKILLAVRFHLYGFGLAGPATLLTVVALVHHLPRRLPPRWFAPGIFRGVVIGFLLMFLTAALKYNAFYFRNKTFTAGGPHDVFRSADGVWERPAHVTTRWILENTEPTDTLLVLPEGISINYFSRRVNPTGQINFMPPEVIMFGENAILTALQAHPPDYCAVIHRLTGEYGVDYNLFGTHYGREILRWVGANYAPVFKYGAEPLHAQRLADGKTGLLILERR